MAEANVLTRDAKGVDRFTVPLYTLSEAAQYVNVPASTFTTWAYGYRRRFPGRPEVIQPPVVTALDHHRRRPSIPFIGLAEGLVLAAVRRRNISLQRIRPALRVLSETIGVEHALASRALYLYGAELLYDYARSEGDTPAGESARQLIVIRNGQGVFDEIVGDFLERITYGPDNYAQVIRLPQYDKAHVVADPARSFGRPIFSHGGARVDDALQLFWAGEDLRTVAEEYGMPEAELEDAVRAASRRAA